MPWIFSLLIPLLAYWMFDVLFFRAPGEDGAGVAAVLMAWKMICMLSPGTIPTPYNTKTHHYLSARIRNVK